MSTLNDEQIERKLGEMTRWTEPQPEVWKRALAQVEADSRAPRDVLGRILNTRISPRWLAIAAVLVVIIATGIVAELTRNRPHREISMGMSSPSNLQNYGAAQRSTLPMVDPSRPASDTSEWEPGNPAPSEPAPGGGGWGGEWPLLSGGGSAVRQPIRGDSGFNQDDVDGVLADRSVIRKATIELVTPDVRAAYLRAAQLISQAQGEFIDDSALQGVEEENITAHLTLRIRADRLDDVLNDLRQLGKVVSEESKGEDVTTQVVDLDARIRNEERIEQELLDLLAKREDAPLKEILELRGEISRVRGRIEQYTAQVQNLSKLVSLATVLVIIRPDIELDEEAAEDDEASIGEYFGDMISDAWDGGVRFLAGSIAVIIRSLVGGAIWIGLVILAFVTIRYARQAANRSGQDSNLRPAA